MGTRTKGYIIMVQHPQSAQYYGITNSVIYNDHPDYILLTKETGKKLFDDIKTRQQR